MKRCPEISLELLRAGSRYPQLISPASEYLALCGSYAIGSLQTGIDHSRLLSCLRHLSYSSYDEEARIGAIEELGKVAGVLLKEIPGLSNELIRMQVGGYDLAHLRLTLSAPELSLIPFELAVAPESLPDHGRPLFAQNTLPIALSRGCREGGLQFSSWDRPPRILLVLGYGSHSGELPSEEHESAIRGAIEVVPRGGVEADRARSQALAELTVLEDTSLADLRRACASGEYTHVHILANSSKVRNGLEEGYGLLLCDDDKSAIEVPGTGVAEALRPHGLRSDPRKGPSFVCIASCDSANPGGLLSPERSLAEEVHLTGVPWVFACQYPLSIRGSVTLTEVLYQSILSGDHPAEILQQARSGLRASYTDAHDWASLVAYSAPAAAYEKDLAAFRRRQEAKIKELRNIEIAIRQSQKGDPHDGHFDAFISYKRGEKDQEFAENLYKTLTKTGFSVAIDTVDFAPEKDFLTESERCVRASRFTLAVISARYLESGNTMEEAVITKVLGMQERKRRIIPLKIEEVETPYWLFGVTGLDFTKDNELIDPMDKLKTTLARSREHPNA